MKVLEDREQLLSSILSDTKGTSVDYKRPSNSFSVVYSDGVLPERQLSDATGAIRDMSTFQIAVLRQKNNFMAIQDFVRDNPEEMTSRILSHVQYVFGIQNLDGLIPKMNQIYIYTQEMSTFVKSVRDILGTTTKDCSDSALLVEIERLLSQGKK